MKHNVVFLFRRQMKVILVQMTKTNVMNSVENVLLWSNVFWNRHPKKIYLDTSIQHQQV